MSKPEWPLDKFRLSAARRLGADLYELFNDAPDLADRFRSQTQRYGRTKAKSVGHVARLSLRHNFEAHVLRDEEFCARGIGTVIGPQTLEVEGGRLSGYDVDYWTVEPDRDFEVLAVEALLKRAGRMDQMYQDVITTTCLEQGEVYDASPYVTVYGFVRSEDPTNPAIADVLQPFGAPSSLTVVDTDLYQISSTAVGQVYATRLPRQ